MTNIILKLLRLTAAQSVVLLPLISGCSINQTQATSPSPTPPVLSTEAAPSPFASLAPSPLPKTDPFQDASDKAISTANISQSALSKDDMNLVVNMWHEAINLMKAVPKSSPNYVLAQKKVIEYQRSLTVAKKKLEKPIQGVKPDLAIAKQSVNNSPEVLATASQASVPQPQVESPQSSNVPAAEEFLEAYFQATVNEGSDGYEYWCSESTKFASSLFAPRGWKILKADDNYGMVRVDSSNKGGSQITTNWRFYLKKEKDKKHTGLPRGLCINLMFTDN